MSKLISKDYFQKTLMKIIKAMKCDLYLITDNMIIGTNEEHSYLSVVSNLTLNVSLVGNWPYCLTKDIKNLNGSLYLSK